jgi:O-antigen/teichoic acid export membrane protein
MASGGTRASIAKVLSGNFAAQAVTLVASLAIARIFSPATFGAYASLAALVAVAGTVGALRLEMAISIAETAEEGDEALRGALSTILATTAVAALALALAGGWLAGVVGLPDGSVGALWLALLAAALAALFTTLNQRAIRARQFGLIATRAVVAAVVTAGVQIGLGLVVPGLYSLVTGLVVGQAVGVGLLARGVGLHAPHLPGRALAHARRHRQLPLYLAPSTLINSVGLQAPVLLGAAVFGASFAGWLGMTQRMIAVPVTVVGAAVGQVFLGELSAMKRDRSPELERQFLVTSAWLAAVGVAGGLALLAVAPLAFSLLFGEAYAPSGTFARALALGVAAQMVASPLAVATVVMGRSRWQLAWDVARLVAVVLVFVAAERLDVGAYATVWCLSVVNAALYVVQWALSYAAIRAGARAWHG